ncbi:translocase of chloroplast 159, chloroplastic-like [Dorcoceras hygrometricum]|uniref:Translocase of chloroplast 159, chloroplastic-like n=1 Tax=Dorcoceras hygrometricum TaxID=472368 RepID=A0A2Z7CTH9_9LAMI|nr:translocase of chloroplast 159, chloroplastic-like [Dorcoceras hygrometricum]
MKQPVPKRKLIIGYESEDAAPLKKMIKASTKPTVVSTSTPKTIAVPKSIEKIAKSRQHSNDESLSPEDILMSLPDDILSPSVTTEDPVTKIRWSQNIEIREVDCRHRSLPQIAPEEQVLVELTRGNPVTEIVDLIFVDVEFFIQIRESVFTELISFLNYLC